MLGRLGLNGWRLRRGAVLGGRWQGRKQIGCQGRELSGGSGRWRGLAGLGRLTAEQSLEACQAIDRLLMSMLGCEASLALLVQPRVHRRQLGQNALQRLRNWVRDRFRGCWR